MDNNAIFNLQILTMTFPAVRTVILSDKIQSTFSNKNNNNLPVCFKTRLKTMKDDEEVFGLLEPVFRDYFRDTLKHEEFTLVQVCFFEYTSLNILNFSTYIHAAIPWYRKVNK
jgi:hypothetical protein